MKTIIHVLCIALVMMIISVEMGNVNASAYGWGYKKSTDHRPPDIGEYEDIIENHQAIYRAKTDEKVIYLTFDNGYEEGYTGDVLDVLQQEAVPATFFVTGHYVDSAPELVQRMAKEGHTIGNHSASHPDFTTMTKKKIKQELHVLENAVADITDQNEMHYLRPPRGTFNEETLSWTEQLGYTHVFWSLAFKDWETDKQQGWEHAYNEVMDQVHPGAIVLLHTVSADNAAALENIIQDLKKEGYTFKSLDDLMVKQALPKEIYELIS